MNAEYALLPPHLERLINAYTKAVIGEAIEAGHALTDGFQLTVSADSDVVLDKVKNRHWIGFKMRGVFQGKRQWEAWRGSLYSAVDHRGRSWPSLLDAVYEFIEKPEWAAGQIALTPARSSLPPRKPGSRARAPGRGTWSTTPGSRRSE